jgi:hypothetical protein
VPGPHVISVSGLRYSASGRRDRRLSRNVRQARARSSSKITVTSGIQTVGMPGRRCGSLADLGGVAGPVAAGETLPGDRDVGVDAQARRLVSRMAPMARLPVD